MSDEITIKKSTYNKLLAALVIAAIAFSFAAGYIMGGVQPTGAVVQQPVQQQVQQQTQQAATVPVVGDAPVKGVADAPLTVIVFSDFSCPYCGGAAGGNQQVVDYFKSRDSTWEAPVPAMIRDYVNTGKVRLAFKYFPGHGTGPDAMKMALCANEQGKFWEVHDLFFENQDSITNMTKLKELVSSTGVDMAKLDQCYTSGKYDSRLSSDQAEGQAAGVSGTPTFIVINKKGTTSSIVGAQPYSAVKKVLDQMLSA